MGKKKLESDAEVYWGKPEPERKRKKHKKKDKKGKAAKGEKDVRPKKSGCARCAAPSGPALPIPYVFGRPMRASLDEQALLPSWPALAKGAGNFTSEAILSQGRG